MQVRGAGAPTDTSATAIARLIEINILQLLGGKDAKYEANGFYLD